MSLSFGFLLLTTILGYTSGSCLKPNHTWLSFDILDIEQPVSDPYLCQAICVDTEECTAFTWTTADNQQFKEDCFLFGQASNQTICEECVSGPASCTCSTEAACEDAGDNIVDQIVAVSAEADCQNYCLENLSCKFYTWHSADSFPAYTCVLLSSCVDTVSCQGCFSGPSECQYEISTTITSPEISTTSNTSDISSTTQTSEIPTTKNNSEISTTMYTSEISTTMYTSEIPTTTNTSDISTTMATPEISTTTTTPSMKGKTGLVG